MLSDEDSITQSPRPSTTSKSSALSYARPAMEPLLKISDIKRRSPVQFNEDHRLENWNRWLNERRKQHDALRKVLKREPGQLVMNNAEDLKSVRDDKTVIEYTRILDPPDPQRGSPVFWRMPQLLRSKRCDDSHLEVVMNSEEKCVIPDIEYVAVPDPIKEEKGVIGGTRPVTKNWETSEYRKKHTEELKKRIKYVQPHKPNMDLMIQGVPISIPKSHMNVVPVITVGEFSRFEEQPTVNYFDRNYKPFCLALKINDIVLKANNTDIYESIENINTSFAVFFEQAVKNKIVASTVRFENQGTATIRFYWHELTKRCTKLPKKLKPKTFFFDKNYSLIPPGQVIVFQFDFMTRIAGTFKEIWEMKLHPTVVTNPIIFTLFGVATEKECDFMPIYSYIDVRSREKDIRDIIRRAASDVMIQSDKDDDIVSPICSVDEKKNFYMANVDKKTGKPLFLYSPETVQKLKNIYDTVKTDEDPQDWDFKIIKLFECIYKKNNLRERPPPIRQIELLTDSLRNYKSKEEININYNKYRLVYNVLISAIDKIERDAFKMEEKYKILKPKTKYPRDLCKNLDNIYTDDSFSRYKRPVEIVRRKTYAEFYPDNTVRCFPIENFYDKRDERLITMSPEERQAFLLHLKAEKEQELSQKAPDNDKKIKPDVSEQLVKKGSKRSLTHPESDENVVDDQGSRVIENQNITLYENVLYMTMYIHLSDAIDGLAAMVDFSNKTTWNDASLSEMMTIVDAHKYHDDVRAVDVPPPARTKQDDSFFSSQQEIDDANDTEYADLYSKYLLMKENKKPDKIDTGVNTTFTPSTYDLCLKK